MSIFSKLFGKKGGSASKEAAQSVKDMNVTLYALANEHYNHGEYDKAFMTMRTVAEQGGDMDAMFNLGMYYIRGIGTEKDAEKGIEWLKKAANKGDDQAAYNVATFYHDGKIVERNLEYALQWYERSAALGNEKAKVEHERLKALLLEDTGSDAENFDVADVVQRMFDEAGMDGHRSDNMFLALTDGTDTTFKTVMQCDKRNLLVYSPFPIPVPEDVAHCVALEINAINESSGEARLSMQPSGNEGVYSIVAMTKHDFYEAPATDEVKTMMIHNIDIMDNGNFKRLACAIFGMATYDDVERQIIGNAEKIDDDGKVRIAMSSGYKRIAEEGKDLTCSRVCSRLLMLSIHIITREISESLAKKYLDIQAELDTIIQCAYNKATPEERDVMRKLQYMRVEKKDESHNDADDMLGRLEIPAMIIQDIYKLLK